MWIGAGCVLSPASPARAAWLAAGVGLVAAVSVLALRSRGRAAAVHVLVVAVASVVVGAGVAGLQEVTRVGEPLATWAEEGASARITGTVASPASLFRPGMRWAIAQADMQTRITVRLRDLDISARGRRIRVDADALADLPGTTAIPQLGSRIAVQGRLGPASSADLTARLRVDGSGDPLIVLAPPGPIDAIVGALRSGLRGAVATLPPDSAAIIAGLAIGDTALTTAELRSQLRSSGLAHLMAVSGGNVAIVLAVAMGLARLGGLGTRGRVLMGIATLTGFVVLVGPQASVLRSAAMGATAVLALLVGGHRSGVAILAFATLAVLLMVPEFAVSWAFALSVAATGGLLVLTEPITTLLRGQRWAIAIPPIVLLGLAVTLSAQLATLPLLVLMGAPVNASAVPANLLAMPAVPLITVLGLLTAVVSPLWPLGGATVGWLAQWPASWIVLVARTFASVTGPALPDGSAGRALVIVAVGIVALRIVTARFGGWVRPTGRLIARGALACLLIAALLTWAAPTPWPRGDWIVIACDVGQGDAVLVRARSGAVMLVDTGPPQSGLVDCLRDARVRQIDLLVITHFHRDHVGGTAELLSSLPIGRAFVSGLPLPRDEARQTLALLAAAGIEVHTAASGTRLQLGSMQATVLWPPVGAPSIDDAGSASDGSIPNNGSVVLLVEEERLRMLLTGDIEEPAQRQIMTRLPGHFDLVKIPHHGSRAGAPDFAAWARARVALISVGAGNPYGHPARQILSEWQAAGARVCRTDQDGACALLRAAGSNPEPELVLARALP